jgi:hypothetical protein
LTFFEFALRGVWVMKVEFRGRSGEAAGVTLQRTSRELRKTINMVEDLEQVVGLALSLAGDGCAEQILELQKLDHIQQKILGVADFLDALSRSMSLDWLVDAKGAARCVLLAELGARLGDAAVPAEDSVGANSNCELF